MGSIHRYGHTPEERFWARVDTSGDCWEWTGANNGQGYGRASSPDGGPEYAHRFSWRLHRGPIPDGLCVLHRCDNPSCVRPEHLFLGSKAENSRDMAQKGRSTRQTQCKRGHPLADPNLVYGKGWRSCRTCMYARSKAYLERKAAAR